LPLPPAAARHVQVLRLQPGAAVTLFNGLGGEWGARVTQMARREVRVQVESFIAVERELPLCVRLAVGIPANERMDSLVEKATELGAREVQPLLTGRSVLRLDGERGARKAEHWQAVAVAACEQCGRNQIPRVHPIARLAAWLEQLPDARPDAQRLLLSPRGSVHPLIAQYGDVLLLSGPEGGLSDAEQQAALARGFKAWSLGPRVLRADTAPLAALAALAMPGQA
jgi:16S rRNA (uracil1498-N3)-methyltransferase